MCPTSSRCQNIASHIGEIPEPECQRQALILEDKRLRRGADYDFCLADSGVNLCPYAILIGPTKLYRERWDRTLVCSPLCGIRRFFALPQNNEQSKWSAALTQGYFSSPRPNNPNYVHSSLLLGSGGGRPRARAFRCRGEGTLFALLLWINAPHGDDAPHVMGNSKVASDSYPKMRW